MVAKPQVLPGAVAAGEYLNVLLGARYRRQWESESEHLPRTSRVQINAVAGVVAALASSAHGYDSSMKWVGGPGPGQGRSLWQHPYFNNGRSRW